MQVLLDRISTPGNFNRFTGGSGQKGETKLMVAVKVQNKYKKQASLSTNLPTLIHKIKVLVSTYKEAHNVKNQTGQSTMVVMPHASILTS